MLTLRISLNLRREEENMMIIERMMLMIMFLTKKYVLNANVVELEILMSC